MLFGLNLASTSDYYSCAGDSQDSSSEELSKPFKGFYGPVSPFTDLVSHFPRLYKVLDGLHVGLSPPQHLFGKFKRSMLETEDLKSLLLLLN